ncbi:MAG: amino acid adenylation domain-containing protein, partial [Cytophagales bacterium]|nr:amino acid adenylation domain-containing protein [Cytophagales bacterium]
ISYCLHDAAACLLLTDQQWPTHQEQSIDHLESSASPVCCPVLTLGQVEEQLSQQPAANPARPLSGSELAYVIYTSGSTGKPKGVLIEHANLSHYLAWANAYYFHDQPGGRFGLLTSVAFDLTVTGLLGTLLRGACLVISSESQPSQALSQLLSGPHAVESLKLTPTHLNLLAQLPLEVERLQTLIVGGETLTCRQVAEWQARNPGLNLYNEYGPTETTVGCTVAHLAGPGLARQGAPREGRSGDASIGDASIGDASIGGPIAHTRLYILDAHQQLLPAGAAGELVVGGRGVGRGYLNQAELTAEKFIDDPFWPGGRLYRTGDLARWGEEGNLEFLGRKDRQVKLRGHRIELGEIEHCLNNHRQVRRSVVTTRPGKDGEVLLVAYYLSRREFTWQELSEHLLGELPAAMVPSHFVRVSKLPLSLSGKLDVKALPDPLTLEQGHYQAPGTALEAQLVEIWQQVLGLSRVGVSDNFFEIGGNSFKIIKLLKLINQDYARSMSILDLFDHTTISKQAVLIAGRLNPEVPAAPEPAGLPA